MSLPPDFEKRLWAAVDRLLAGTSWTVHEWKMPVLGLLFLKYADLHGEYLPLASGPSAGVAAEAERSTNLTLRVPDGARFGLLLECDPRRLGQEINRALMDLERANWKLRDLLPTSIDLREADQPTLWNLLRILDSIPKGSDADDFGRTYEHFLRAFARLSRGSEYTTPPSVGQLMVEVIEPFAGKVHDPCCGAAGTLVRCARFAQRHRQTPGQLSLSGAEVNQETLSVATMNLAIHGLRGDLQQINSLYEDTRVAGQFDFVVSQPPFNVRGVDKHRIETTPERFPLGVPTSDNANYLWIQIFIGSLNDTGRAAFVMANSASDSRGSELEIRKRLIESGVVDAMVAICPGFLESSSLPITLWFLDKGKPRGDRRGGILFIDARDVFRQIDRKQRDFAPEQIEYLAGIVRMYRRTASPTSSRAQTLIEKTFPGGSYRDVPGLCRVASLKEVEAQAWSLNPGRYVGVTPTTEMRLRGLRLHNVYGFESLDLRFPERSPVVLVGANGAGKSTVLDSIAMFLSPLSALLQDANPRNAPYCLTRDAIHIDQDSADAELDVESGGADLTWRVATDRKTSRPAVNPGMTKWVKALQATLETNESTPLPVLRYYPAARTDFHYKAPKKQPRSRATSPPQLGVYADAFDMGEQSFERIVLWFRREEDLENELRLGDSPAYVNPRLDGVRQAVLRFLDRLSAGKPGTFDDLRVRRDLEGTLGARLVLRKEGKELPLDTLSDGERGSILLVADLAQRLVTANPGASDPLSGPGIVLIDEIELHLHPRWQRAILPALTETFPECQFVVTTHSPQVLSRVPRDQILLFSRFKPVEHLPHTEGRDTNAILAQLMGVPSRPEEAAAEIDDLARRIDAEDLEGARGKLSELEERFGPNDSDLLRLGAMLHTIEGDPP